MTTSREKNPSRPNQDFPSDLKSCDLLETELLNDIATIKAQIARAVSKAKVTGNYASNHWFTDANKSLRLKQTMHQALQKHAAGLRKVMKQNEADSFAKHFFTAARTLLPKETYFELVSEARRLAALDPKSSENHDD